MKILSVEGFIRIIIEEGNLLLFNHEIDKDGRWIILDEDGEPNGILKYDMADLPEIQENKSMLIALLNFTCKGRLDNSGAQKLSIVNGEVVEKLDWTEKEPDWPTNIKSVI